MEIEGSGATRAGDDDVLNEDAYLVEDGLGLYVVCDGLSRAPAGEVAARVAVSALEQFVARAVGGVGRPWPRRRLSPQFASDAITAALDAVLRAAQSDPSLDGMSSTVTMLLTQGRTGVIGHVGDSRASLIRASRLHRLTVDHEWTDVVDREFPGDWTHAPVDTFSVPLVAGDTFVLCTDGAEAVVDDPALAQIADALSPRQLSRRIVSSAHRRDPHADATVVVVRVRREDDPGWLWLSAVPRATAFGHAVGVAA